MPIKLFSLIFVMVSVRFKVTWYLGAVFLLVYSGTPFRVNTFLNNFSKLPSELRIKTWQLFSLSFITNVSP